MAAEDREVLLGEGLHGNRVLRVESKRNARTLQEMPDPRPSGQTDLAQATLRVSSTSSLRR